MPTLDTNKRRPTGRRKAWHATFPPDEIAEEPLGRPMARTVRPEDAELCDRIREGRCAVLSGDLEIPGGRQSNLMQGPERRLFEPHIDVGGMPAAAA